MFSVESAVRQVKPDFILQHVLEAEDSQWTKVHLDGEGLESSLKIHDTTSTSVSSDCSDPGIVLLRHGTSVKKIHNYFSQLEFRKCCLHLAGRKSTFQSMRVVLSGSNVADDGSTPRRRVQTFVTHLEDKELRAFKHAYLCAAYPVLAAPDPPSPFSPSPVNPVTQPLSPQRVVDLQKMATRTVTPHSLHDSGLEESEDLAFVPSESICAHLQRAFHLTDEKFRDYRYLINKTYIKKSAQKLLAEVLAGQLSVLENNGHPFYKPQDFVPPSGYDIWRKAEHNHITVLLGKFWHYSLPFPCNSQDLIAELHSVHDDYRILLRKLLAYERESQRQTEEEGGKVTSFLSSASIRLLKEFGLRYGVGEQFRRILYLEQMSLEFSPCLWYLRHILGVLNSISDMLPSNRHALSMVQREREMLQSSLVRLTAQASKTLEQMKSLFPGNKPDGAVEMLIALLQRVRDIRLYLSSPVQEPPALRYMLRDVVQGMFFQTYEKCKTVIRTELRQSRDMHVCPRLLNALIMEMRDEVNDYKNNFEATFTQYFDITVMAAKAFYSFLMKDVDLLCQQEKLRDSAIDLRMLALVHRLNQLDHDWSAFVTTQDHSWRQSFQVHIERWGHALQTHVQDLVLEIIAGDVFVTQPLHLPTGGSFSSTSSSSGAQARSVSIAPSVNSAFSSIPSTPRQGSSLSNKNVNGAVSEVPPKNMSTKHADRDVGDTRQDKHSGTAQPEEDFLSFADKRRQCASVPAFSDRPAMVRAMSDLQMLTNSHPNRLHTVSAVDDLRSSENGRFAASQLRGGAGGVSGDREARKDSVAGRGMSDVCQPQQEKEPYILDSVSDCEDMDDGILEMEAPAVDADGELSDSDDEEYSYPPIQEVTDLNVSQPAVSSSYDSKQRIGQQGMAGSVSEGKKAFKDHASSLSSQGDGRDKTSGTKPIATSRGGGTSLVHPYTNSLLHSSTGSLTSSGLSPQREPLRLHPHPTSAFQIHQPSPFRKISTSSVANSSEPSSDRDHQFLQSIHSAVSFPSPTHCCEVVIPVSGSAVDMVIILHRTLGFGKSLCHTIFPQEVRPSPDPHTEPERDALAWRAALQSYEDKVYVNIVQVMCQGLKVYADNMLCLDLCAVPKDIARRVIGSMLVDHAIRQQRARRIWGCRHQLEGHENCFAFHNRHATFLCDRYEPITQKMCVRINNVTACQHYLDWCSRETQTANLHSPPASVSNHAPTAASGEAARSSSTDSGTHTSGNEKSDHSESDSDDINSSKQQLVDDTCTHLKSVWNALCRLLAFRINLFLRDGMALLLSLKPSKISIETGLMPVTSFLRSHLDALSSWLYSSSFRRVIEFLWIYIVQDIENEACKLSRPKNSKLTPDVLLQTLSHLMTFMNNCEKGITRELMLSQAEDVMTKLQLLTLATANLIALYYRLLDMWSEGANRSSMEDAGQPIRTSALALHQLRHDLQTRHKCFSGVYLVRWIMHHPDLFMSPDELSLCRGQVAMSIQGAEDIAQQMLDQQLILDVERENSMCSRPSSTLANPHYPAVSIHTQRETGTDNGPNDDDDTTSIDTDITPTPTPHHGFTRSQGSQQKVVVEVHATPVDTGSPPRLLPPDAPASSSEDSGGHSDARPTPTLESTNIKPDASNKITPVSVTEPVNDAAHQAVTLQSALTEGNIHQKRSALREPSEIIQTVAQGMVVDPKLVSPSPVEGEGVVAVVGHVTVPPAPTDFMDSTGKVQSLKPQEGPSDFEDSGVVEVHYTSRSDTSETSQSAEMPVNTVGVHIASPSSSRSRTTEEQSTPCDSGNSSTPLAHHPANLQTPSSEHSFQATPVYEVDHSSTRTTPTSMRSVTPFTAGGGVFENSHKRFYFMPASPSQPGRSSSHLPSAQLLTGVLSYLNRSLTILKNSQETNTLAEKCFNLKIKPVSILGIIHGRRRTDSIALNFLHELPPQVLDEVRRSMETRAAECSVL